MLTPTESQTPGKHGLVCLHHSCGKVGHQVRDCHEKSFVMSPYKDTIKITMFIMHLVAHIMLCFAGTKKKK